MQNRSVPPVRFVAQGIPGSPVAVLASGGITSSVLIRELADHCQAVYPLYVRLGNAVDTVEEVHLRRLLAAIRGPRLGRLSVLDLGAGDTNANREIVLRWKVATWCRENRIEYVATGKLAADSPSFGASPLPEPFGSLPAGLGEVRVLHPFAALTKLEVVGLGLGLPFAFTFSCTSPLYTSRLNGAHCGQCRKCVERIEAFASGGQPEAVHYRRAEASGAAALA